MEDMRSGIEHLKQAKAHMSEANGIMSDHISKLKALEEENAELKAELETWIQSDDSYMKLPLDADGEPIRIGDEVNIDGDAMTVLGYRLHNDMLLLVAKDKKRPIFFTPEPSIVRHFKPERPDSWERIEDDAYHLVMSEYLETPEEDVRDLVRRAKALAKAGEVE